jgi:hypothetical protein
MMNWAEVGKVGFAREGQLWPYDDTGASVPSITGGILDKYSDG